MRDFYLGTSPLFLIFLVSFVVAIATIAFPLFRVFFAASCVIIFIFAFFLLSDFWLMLKSA